MKVLSIKRLTEVNVERCIKSWCGLDEWSVAEWGNAAAGEVGEACNVAKKMLRLDKNMRVDLAAKSRDEYKKDLAQEISDAMIYLILWAASEGIDLEAALIKTFNDKSDEIGSDIKL